MPTLRRPALDFGGPMSISPVDRSTKGARTRTVAAVRSRSTRRSAVASPQRRLAKVARSTRARTAGHDGSRRGRRWPASTAPARPRPCWRTPPVRYASRRDGQTGAGSRPGFAECCRPGGARLARPARRPAPRSGPAVRPCSRPRAADAARITGRSLSSSTAVVRIARTSRYALAATETDTPLDSSAARHSRIWRVDSFPTCTPPR